MYPESDLHLYEDSELNKTTNVSLGQERVVVNFFLNMLNEF